MISFDLSDEDVFWKYFLPVKRCICYKICRKNPLLRVRWNMQGGETFFLKLTGEETFIRKSFFKRKKKGNLSQHDKVLSRLLCISIRKD